MLTNLFLWAFLCGMIHGLRAWMREWVQHDRTP
jgi:hypothetical protein